MTRTARHDVDYFPFYVKDGKTLFILESKYGLQGIGFFTNLMRFLCKQPDHHICIEDESTRLYFFAQLRCPEELGTDMLNLMAKTGKIDAGLWDSRRVITSEDLIDSLNDAYRNRVNPIIEIDQIRVSYPRKAISEVGKAISEVSYPQTKLNKTKLKETIYGDSFLTFWKTYPKKIGKDAAWRAWKNRNGSRPEIEIILKAITAQSQSEQWRKESGQFIPNPATWINQGRWEDEPLKTLPSYPSKSKTESGERDVREYLSEEIPEETEEVRLKRMAMLEDFTKNLGRASP